MKFAPQSAEKEPVPETIPSATTPKRHREEDDIPAEPLGDTKRVHVDAQVTVADQFFEPPLQDEFLAPEDIKIDPSVQPVIAQPQPVETLATTITQLTIDIQSDNEEFINRYRIWSPSGTPAQNSELGDMTFGELPLDLAVRHCMYG